MEDRGRPFSRDALQRVRGRVSASMWSLPKLPSHRRQPLPLSITYRALCTRGGLQVCSWRVQVVPEFCELKRGHTPDFSSTLSNLLRVCPVDMSHRTEGLYLAPPSHMEHIFAAEEVDSAPAEILALSLDEVDHRHNVLTSRSRLFGSNVSAGNVVCVRATWISVGRPPARLGNPW